MVYFGVFFVLPDSVGFPDFYAKITDFKANIFPPSLHLRMLSPSVIYGWHTHVAQSRRGVGCEVGQEEKQFCAGGQGNCFCAIYCANTKPKPNSLSRYL